MAIVAPECFLGLSPQERRQQMYEAIYTWAGDETLTDPECFLGLSPEEQFFAFLDAANLVQGQILFEYHAGDSINALGGTFSRSSTATYTDQSGVIQTAASNVLRDWHYIAGTRYTLLEGQRTNACPYSEDFTKFFSNGDRVLASAAGTAPNGTETATTASFGSGGYMYQDCSPGGDVNGRTFTYSIWVWSPTKSVIGIRLSTLEGGDATNTNINLTDTPTRVTLTQTFTTSSTGISVGLDNRGGIGGDGVAGDVHVWGAQLEESPFASSYIPTAGSAVTRAADSLSFPFPYPPQEMSFYARTVVGDDINSAYFFDTGSERPGASRIAFYRNAGVVKLYHGPQSGAGEIDVNHGGINTGDVIEVAGTLHADGGVSVSCSVNGGPVSTGGPLSTGALAESVAGNILYIARRYSDNDFSFDAFRDLIIARGTHDLDWFRSRIAP